MSALLAVAWKEARELIAGRHTAWGAAAGIVVLGVLPVAAGGTACRPGVLMIHFLSVPAVLSLLWATDSFAGERERGTLDTLLASPVPDASLAAGKLLVGVAGAWAAGLLAHGIARAADLALGRPEPAADVAILIAAALLTALAGGLAGTLGSLRAHTVREAMARLFLPWIALDTALRWVAARTGWTGWSERSWLAALAVVDLALIAALAIAFRRPRLVLAEAVRPAPSGAQDPTSARPGPVARRPSVLRDVATVVWKELVAIRRMQLVAPWLTAALAVLVLVVLVPQAVGDAPDAWQLPQFFPLFAFGLVPLFAVETAAGERVRGTWETLRSSRLDVRALFLGKALSLWLFAVVMCGAMSLLTFAGLALRRGWPDAAALDPGAWSSLLALGGAAAAASALLAVGSMCRTDSYKVAQSLGAAMCAAPLALLGLADRLSESGVVGLGGGRAAWILAASFAVVALAVGRWGWRRFRAV